MNAFKKSLLGFACLASASFPVEAQQTGDAAKGAALFQERCVICHTPGGGQGPALNGVVGRVAGSAANFSYTRELKDSRLTFDETTLDKYLANPQAMVRGTAMPITVPDARERAQLIAYLRALPAMTASSSVPALNSSVPSSSEDWNNDKPGTRHRFTVGNLPTPFQTESARNPPRTGVRTEGVELSVKKGLTVQPFVKDLTGPRVLRTAPNGDIFVAETRAGRIRVLRAGDGAAQPTKNEIFAEGLSQPFGIAFYPAGNDPKWVYVANINNVVRFPYENGDLIAGAPAQVIVEKLADTTSGHSTRDIVFSKDGKRMLVSVGSSSNVAEGIVPKTSEEIREWEREHGVGSAWGVEADRATVLSFDSNGRDRRPFATGIRNCVGLTVHPITGDPWCAVNERDLLGDNLVPDYVSSIKEGKFYGWPWYYLGNNPDPRHKNAPRSDLIGKITVPDLLVQPHSAALQILFYTADSGSAALPPEYRGDAFITFHGSWNRGRRTGYKVVHAFMKNGKPTGEYEDFLTGFVIDDGTVWGRPVGITVAHDGALLVSDDGSNTIWRVARKK